MALIRAIDRVLDKMQEQERCPFCPADVWQGHARGCPMVALLREREDFGSQVIRRASKPADRTKAGQE